MSGPIVAAGLARTGMAHLGQMVVAQAKTTLVPQVMNSLQAHLGKQIVSFSQAKLSQHAHQFAAKRGRTDASSRSALAKRLKAAMQEIALLKKQVEELTEKSESTLSELADLKQKSEKPQSESEGMESARTQTEEAIRETQEMAESKRMRAEAKLVQQALDAGLQYL